jgi:dTDP-4-dehydrorhamnose reductase
MWGGIECTVNRVQDRYINQCEKNGHTNRLSDLELFTSLGIQKLRYPCLWEVVAPRDLNDCDWKYLDERLETLRKLKQKLIAGFLHHGSGPIYTNLIDEEFPLKFAHYAMLFAQRYPWVNDFTPINEINTTARFSFLYGHWFPHLKDETSYLRSLMIQTKGTILAMKEIRKINPHARLILTDDLGKCQSTEELKDQCEFENQRRWLSWDLVSGMVTKNHPLYWWFIKCKINPKDLIWLEENACPPDVIGINHYHLSNRYLDHRLELFPVWSHGGNGRQNYADIGAIDTGLVDPIDPEDIFQEAWARYKRTIAITECHTNGFQEAQMRWLNQIWKTSEKLRSRGVKIEAVTAWSLLGTFDWHNLCTKCENYYEPGVFDLRNNEGIPKPTSLSRMVTSLARNGSFESPLLGSVGKWKTGRRILFQAKPGQFTSLEHHKEIPPILILNTGRELEAALISACGERNIKFQEHNLKTAELTEINLTLEEITDINPWAIIYTSNFKESSVKKIKQTEFDKTIDSKSTNLKRICLDHKIKLIEVESRFNALADSYLCDLPRKFLKIVVNPDSSLSLNHMDLANQIITFLVNEQEGIIYITPSENSEGITSHMESTSLIVASELESSVNNYRRE